MTDTDNHQRLDPQPQLQPEQQEQQEKNVMESNSLINGKEKSKTSSHEKNSSDRRRSRSLKKSSRRRNRSRSHSSSYRRNRSSRSRYSRSRSSSHDRSSSRRKKRRSSSSSRSRSSSPEERRKNKKEKVSKFSDNKLPTVQSNPLQALSANALTALQQQQQLALRLVLAGNTNTTPLFPPQNPLTTSSLFPFPSTFSNSPLSQLGGISAPGTTLPLVNPLLTTPIASLVYTEPKEHKELFVGNTPSGVNEMLLLEFLNAAMRHSGLYSGPESVEPIVTCRLNSKFAFVETRTAQDATNAMNLDNIPFLGNFLKIGRPTKYFGPVTPHVTWQELISGPGFTKLNPSEQRSSITSEVETSKPTTVSPTNLTLPLPGVSLSQPHSSTPDASTKMFRELFVGNTSAEMNGDNLKEFLGNALEKMGFLSSPGNPILQVRVNPRFSFIELRSIEEAANCCNLNGIPFLGQTLKISRPAKYVGALVTHYTWDDILSRWMTGELKILTSGPSSRVLMFSNMVVVDDLIDDTTYQEIIQDTRDEISQHGRIKSLIIPRPSDGSSTSLSLHKGIGKVFIEMASEAEAKTVLVALKGRTFDGRIVDVKYFPYEKFLIQDYSDPPPVILTANGFIDIDTILGNKLPGNTITMNTPTAAQLSSYAHLNPPSGPGTAQQLSSHMYRMGYSTTTSSTSTGMCCHRVVLEFLKALI